MSVYSIYKETHSSDGSATPERHYAGWAADRDEAILRANELYGKGQHRSGSGDRLRSDGGGSRLPDKRRELSHRAAICPVLLIVSGRASIQHRPILGLLIPPASMPPTRCWQRQGRSPLLRLRPGSTLGVQSGGDTDLPGELWLSDVG